MFKLTDRIKTSLIKYSLVENTSTDPNHIRVKWMDLSGQDWSHEEYYRKSVFFHRTHIPYKEITKALPKGDYQLWSSPYYAAQVGESEGAYLKRLKEIYDDMPIDLHGDVAPARDYKDTAKKQRVVIEELVEDYSKLFSTEDDRGRNFKRTWVNNKAFSKSLDRILAKPYWPCSLSPLGNSVAAKAAFKNTPVLVRARMLRDIIHPYWPGIASGELIDNIAVFNHINIFRMMQYFAGQKGDLVRIKEFEEEFQALVSVAIHSDNMAIKCLAAHIIYPFADLQLLPLKVNMLTQGATVDSARVNSLIELIKANPVLRPSKDLATKLWLRAALEALPTDWYNREFLAEISEGYTIDYEVSESSTTIGTMLNGTVFYDSEAGKAQYRKESFASWYHLRGSSLNKLFRFLLATDIIYGYSGENVAKGHSCAAIASKFVQALPADFLVDYDSKDLIEACLSDNTMTNLSKASSMVVQPPRVLDL